MNKSSVANSVAGAPVVRVNNYDVLLLRSENSQSLRFAPGIHVGNCRFTVLLSLFRQRYMQAYMLGEADECIEIAHEILETVCNKCIPNGRFFIQGHNNKWRQCKQGDPSVISLIQTALKKQPRQLPRINAERCPKRVCRGSAGFELLYKAASKQLASPEKLVPSPKTFDVVCDADGVSLTKGDKHTGNNRLSVLLDIRMKQYQKTDKEEKNRIAAEVVSSIVDDAGARFLQSDKQSGKYKLLPRESAVACVKRALDTASEVEKQKFRDAEVKKLRCRRHKKAILDRLENQRGGKSLCDVSSTSKPPTTFAALRRPNKVASRAA
ncbi:hypothetical protein ACHAWF_003020 [Thalassiosira exigua]